MAGLLACTAGNAARKLRLGPEFGADKIGLGILVWTPQTYFSPHDT